MDEKNVEKYPRARQAKWDKGNMRTVTTKLPLRKYRKLLDLCMLAGVSPYRYLKTLLMEAIEVGRVRR